MGVGAVQQEKREYSMAGRGGGGGVGGGAVQQEKEEYSMTGRGEWQWEYRGEGVLR